jgi:anti-sigma B factor antagonist
MEWTTDRQANAIIGRPVGRIDEAGWEAFLAAMEATIGDAAGASQPLIVDLAKVDYMSSRGLRALTMAKRSADAKGVTITLARANERMREILAISRYDKIFPVTDTL